MRINSSLHELGTLTSASSGRRDRAVAIAAVTKITGISVINEMNQTIGTIDKFVVTRDGKEPFALAVGQWLPA